MTRFKVLSTKKLSSSLVGTATQKGIEIIEKSFISTKPILSDEKCREITGWLSAGIANAVFTSANAVKPFETYIRYSGEKHLPGWNIFSLSGKTREELTKPYAIELGSLIATADSASDLASRILSEKIKEIIFFCGNQRRDELLRILSNAGVKVHEVIVYETEEKPVKMDENFDGILFFSPSAVSSFFSLNQSDNTAVYFAIGKTTADALVAKKTGNQIIISPSPSEEMLLNQLLSFVDHIKKDGDHPGQDNRD